MKFFKAIVSGNSIPIDNNEIEKILGALKKSSGMLVLKQGVIDLRHPVHIVPDQERNKQYESTPYKDERTEIATLKDSFVTIREYAKATKLIEK